MTFVLAHKTEILAALLALSEILAATPLKSNSVFQLAVNLIKSMAGK